MGLPESALDSDASAESQSDSGGDIANGKGHDDSIIIVAAYVYEVLGSRSE